MPHSESPLGTAISSRTFSVLRSRASKRFRGFTLVELIVVITILAILATIGFLALSGYTSDANKSAVVGNLRTVEKGLATNATVTGKFPMPTDYVDVTYSGGVAWRQGTAGKSVMSVIGMGEPPKDPQGNSEFDYSLSANGMEYQVASAYLSAASAEPFAREAAAATTDGKNVRTPTAAVSGNYNGLFVPVVSSGANYLVAAPTIILANATASNRELKSMSPMFVVDGKPGTPASWSGKISGLAQTGISFGGTAYASGKIFESATEAFPKTSSGVATVADALAAAYTGSAVASVPKIQSFLSAPSNTSTAVSAAGMNALGRDMAPAVAVITTTVVVPENPSLGTPSNLAAVSVTPSGFSLAFSGVSWATRYEASVDGGTSWNLSASAPPIAVSGLADASSYSAKVRACDANGCSPASAAITATTQQSPNLVGWWDMETLCAAGNCGAGNDGKLKDLSGNGNHAICQDGAAAGTCGTAGPPIVDGDGTTGKAMSFDGNLQLLRVPNSASLNPSYMTVYSKAYSSGTGTASNSYPRVFSKGNSATSEQYAAWYSYGGIGWSVQTRLSPTYQLTSQSNLSFVSATAYQNKWTRLGFTYDGTDTVTYFNGAASHDALNYSGALASSTRDLVIGNAGWSGGYTRAFKWKIDEVRIYDRALSEIEIQALDKAIGGVEASPPSCGANQPTSANAGTLTTGSPTSVAQAWTYSATPGNCTYSCLNGYSGTNCAVAPIPYSVSATVHDHLIANGFSKHGTLSWNLIATASIPWSEHVYVFFNPAWTQQLGASKLVGSYSVITERPHPMDAGNNLSFTSLSYWNGSWWSSKGWTNSFCLSGDGTNGSTSTLWISCPGTYNLETTNWAVLYAGPANWWGWRLAFNNENWIMTYSISANATWSDVAVVVYKK